MQSYLDPRVGAVALALLVATPGLAQTDLVTNGSFELDVGVLGWEPVEDDTLLSLEFDPADVDDREDSGSARVTFKHFIGFVPPVHVTQCVAVHPGRTYTGSLSFLIPTGQNRPGSAALRVAWHESSDCRDPARFAFGNSGDQVGDWTELAPFDFVVPDDIFGAEVQLEVKKDVTGSTLFVLFDEVMFVPEPSPSLGGLTALFGVAGVARWKRLRARC